jgi:hypothetical protein
MPLRVCPNDPVTAKAVTQDDPIIFFFVHPINFDLNGFGHVFRSPVEAIIKKLKFHLTIVALTDLFLHHLTSDDKQF